MNMKALKGKAATILSGALGTLVIWSGVLGGGFTEADAAAVESHVSQIVAQIALLWAMIGDSPLKSDD